MSDYIKITHIGVINMMRNRIGLPDLNFKFALGKSEQELEELRDEIIIHYNQALTNQNRIMTRLEKAVANLESKGVDCKTYNDTVYVIVDWNELELSDFEIDFQAGEYEENLDFKKYDDE